MAPVTLDSEHVKHLLTRMARVMAALGPLPEQSHVHWELHPDALDALRRTHDFLRGGALSGTGKWGDWKIYSVPVQVVSNVPLWDYRFVITHVPA